MPTHHFMWIRHSALLMAIQVLLFGTFSCFLSPNIFDQWLVESSDVKTHRYRRLTVF